MLGKMTRWLRILGCDVKYYKDIDDEILINLAEEEDRILLTCDIQLYRRAIKLGKDVFLIRSQNEIEQLAKLAHYYKFKLSIVADKSRCPKCNGKIRSIPKSDVEDEIPKLTSKFFKKFWICTRCKQIFWHGSHWENITNKLIQAERVRTLRLNRLK
jgi:uncharacterized protein with PIN domain